MCRPAAVFLLGHCQRRPERDAGNLSHQSLERGEAWDSGVVKSDQSAFVDYEGKALDSLTDYMWSVEVTDNAGHSASADSVFETG